MRRADVGWWIAAGMVAFLLGGAAPGAAEPVSPAPLLERLQARYGGLPPFRASFRQSLVSPTFGEEEQAAGEILVGADGRIAWNYREPAGMRAVFDGREWRLLDPEERELVVRRADLPGREGDRLLADLLAGKERLLDLFAPLPGEGGPDRLAGPRVVVRLLPRTPRDDIDRIELEIDPGPPDLRGVTVVDPLGSRMVVRLGAPERVRGGFPAGTFVLRVPEGYTITRD